jgi:hypothetical protein
VGVNVGAANATCCAIQFRDLRIDPLPVATFVVTMPPNADDAAKQKAIGEAIDEAKALAAKKQGEQASWLLHDALAHIATLPAGDAHDRLRKSAEQAIAQADAIAAKRSKAAQAIAAELVTLGDAYAKAARPRLALVLVEGAAAFDPEGQAARLAAARQAAAK